MFPLDWFDTFAATVPGRLIEIELEGIARTLPVQSFRRILDVGCGIGRIAGPLAARGYSLTGLDINVDALAAARRRARGPC